MFRIFKDKCQAQEGAPIDRIMGQLGAIGKAIYLELEPGVRNPECSRGCLGQKRNDLKESGMNPDNRGIYNYFKERIVVKSHKSAEIIRGELRNRRIYGRSGGISVGYLPRGLPSLLRRAGGLLNSDALRRQFGSADVYDSSSISLNRHRIPGSRVSTDKNNDMKGEWACWKCRREANCAELRDEWRN